MPLIVLYNILVSNAQLLRKEHVLPSIIAKQYATKRNKEPYHYRRSSRAGHIVWLMPGHGKPRHGDPNVPSNRGSMLVAIDPPLVLSPPLLLRRLAQALFDRT